MTLEEAIERVQKLLKLSTSDNPNESAAALKQAQKMLLQYGIEQEMLEEHEPKEEPIADGGVVERTSPFNMDTWKKRLAHYLAEANTCRSLIMVSKHSCAIRLFGRPSDVAKVRYLYAYFRDEVERLCDRDGVTMGRTWRNNYRHGVVDTLQRALHEAQKDNAVEAKSTQAGSRALVRIDTRAVAVGDFLKKNFKIIAAKGSPMSHDEQARLHGRVAGKEITVTKARGALGGT